MAEPDKTMVKIVSSVLVAGDTIKAKIALSNDKLINYRIPVGRKATVTVTIQAIEEDV